ncbi:DUF4287 domain-containing protein [Hyphomonas sp.]|jgi:hypothetical protein|uniref:DUF4287 domain-containing protein n=1 Tax=Hyphomonas sp. TaxID=87 RepID=UPI0035629CDF
MAMTAEEMMASMKAGLKAKTGKPLEDWVKIVKASGIEKHGEQVTMLKTDHGLGGQFHLPGGKRPAGR